MAHAMSMKNLSQISAFNSAWLHLLCVSVPQLHVSGNILCNIFLFYHVFRIYQCRKRETRVKVVAFLLTRHCKLSVETQRRSLSNGIRRTRDTELLFFLALRCTEQGDGIWECSVETLRVHLSPNYCGIACQLAKLNAALCLLTYYETKILNISKPQVKQNKLPSRLLSRTLVLILCDQTLSSSS